MSRSMLIRQLLVQALIIGTLAALPFFASAVDTQRHCNNELAAAAEMLDNNACQSTAN